MAKKAAESEVPIVCDIVPRPGWVLQASTVDSRQLVAPEIMTPVSFEDLIAKIEQAWPDFHKPSINAYIDALFAIKPVGGITLDFEGLPPWAVPAPMGFRYAVTMFDTKEKNTVQNRLNVCIKYGETNGKSWIKPGPAVTLLDNKINCYSVLCRAFDFFCFWNVQTNKARCFISEHQAINMYLLQGAWDHMHAAKFHLGATEDKAFIKDETEHSEGSTDHDESDFDGGKGKGKAIKASKRGKSAKKQGKSVQKRGKSIKPSEAEEDKMLTSESDGDAMVIDSDYTQHAASSGSAGPSSSAPQAPNTRSRRSTPATTRIPTTLAQSLMALGNNPSSRTPQEGNDNVAVTATTTEGTGMTAAAAEEAATATTAATEEETGTSATPATTAAGNGDDQVNYPEDVDMDMGPLPYRPRRA
ncbi:hypothetical protein GGR52DRAFT_568719 [Hypoxylon sp. FL1284]|nr:hypothetical protein GGR52DRAFT_568719 [Hypoxylon sp. FL1284]